MCRSAADLSAGVLRVPRGEEVVGAVLQGDDDTNLKQISVKYDPIYGIKKRNNTDFGILECCGA
jgi:hypothetical protein